MRVDLVTCTTYPTLSDSDALLAAELTQRGVEVRDRPWNAPDPAWTDPADLVVIRSSWDYHTDVEGYERWLRAITAAGATVVNPVDLVVWSLRKRYLLELAGQGVTIPLTSVIEPWMSLRPGWLADDEPVVVKPLVGASSVGVSLVGPERLDEALAAARHSGRTLLLQEFIDDLGGGEWSLVFFDGEYSHAFQRVAAPAEVAENGLYAGASAARVPSADLIAFAADVVPLLPAEPAYVRVDLMVRETGPVVIEVEVNEPALRLEFDPEAPARFADAVLARRA
ncbi:MAG: ATP-grasp domain-containing protein [Actinomycetota bacterium]